MIEATNLLSNDEHAHSWPATVKSAIAYSVAMQEMLRHTDFPKMSAFTNGASNKVEAPAGITVTQRPGPAPGQEPVVPPTSVSIFEVPSSP